MFIKNRYSIQKNLNRPTNNTGRGSFIPVAVAFASIGIISKLTLCVIILAPLFADNGINV